MSAPVDHEHAGQALGTVDFPVSCSEPARAEFKRAAALLHHMTYPQAREAFQQVATTDPRCAMAHWGIAMTLFQPLWPTRPQLEARKQGWEAVQKAKTLLPAHELLGDLLMEQKQPQEALAAYQRSIELYPKRVNGLLGAARAARALGDQSLARTFYQELLESAGGATRQSELKEAQSFVAQRR